MYLNMSVDVGETMVCEREAYIVVCVGKVPCLEQGMDLERSQDTTSVRMVF